VDERARRVGENEALFRAVNEQVRELNRRFDAPDGLVVVCECGLFDCMERLELRADEYEALRASGTRFAVKAGHVAPDVERVVDRKERFWVVEKIEEDPARLARETDPRG